jgi:hypothetical protein
MPASNRSDRLNTDILDVIFPTTMPTYTGISSEAFQHPLDRQAEAALRSVPGFDLIASKFVEFVYERPQFVYLWEIAFKSGRANMPASITFSGNAFRL